MSTCDLYLSVISEGWQSGIDTLPWLNSDANWLMNNYITGGGTAQWWENVAGAISMLRNIVTWILKGQGAMWSQGTMIKFLTNCVGGASMADILTAMQGASFEQLTSFMGITQAYKVAVWDAPFNEEFYAALARGFKTWGT